MGYTLNQLVENGGVYVDQDTLEQARDEVDAMERAKDARIAELTAEVAAWKKYHVQHTAEVARLRALVKEAYEEGVSDTDADEEGRWEESHASNALREKT